MSTYPRPKTLDPSLVAILLDAVGTQFLTVEYVKKDGNIGRTNGLLRATSRLVGNARGQTQGNAMKDRGQVWIAKSRGGSASFFLDRVTSIQCRGAGIDARA
jgi:hypothetical protein